MASAALAQRWNPEIHTDDMRAQTAHVGRLQHPGWLRHNRSPISGLQRALRLHRYDNSSLAITR
ncbi:hypothetical protein EAH79_11955 [Sphingomonas koreensis]|nr:hypothetical protein EAH79_11955 [Sphingomonas koreensis]